MIRKTKNRAPESGPAAALAGSTAALARTAFSLAIGLGCILGAALAAEPPDRTVTFREALQNERWQEIEPGLWRLHTRVQATSVDAFRIDDRFFRFSVSVQTHKDGDTAERAGLENGAMLSVNGGFFGERSPARDLFAVGLLRVDGKTLSTPWTRQGGYLVVEDAGLSIVPTREGIADSHRNVIQSRPVLIESGGRWAMRTNRMIQRPRTLICLLADGDTLLVIVSGVGLSLFEAGWLLREPAAGGYFGCDSAIALDGGSSTQLWHADNEQYSIAGDAMVHNFLHVVRRANSP